MAELEVDARVKIGQRLFGGEVQDPARGHVAKQDRRRAFEELDLFDVVGVIVAEVPDHHAVPAEILGVDEVKSAGVEKLVRAGTAVVAREIESADVARQGNEVERTLLFDRFLAHHHDGLRDVLHFQQRAGGGGGLDFYARYLGCLQFDAGLTHGNGYFGGGIGADGYTLAHRGIAQIVDQQHVRPRVGFQQKFTLLTGSGAVFCTVQLHGGVGYGQVVFVQYPASDGAFILRVGQTCGEKQRKNQ